MHILLSNDDGIYAEGLRAAAECLSEFAQVTIVAPDSEQSAVSSKITTSLPLRVHRYNISSKFESYAVNGTPTDCIKLALGVILKNKPDIVVSGINHGSNTGFNIIYSGTVAAAVEGMLNGIPSIAVSVTDMEFYDFRLATKYLPQIIQHMHEKKLAEHVFLNMNVPPIDANLCEGIEFCPLSRNRYIEDFQLKKDPRGRDYYWLGGKKTDEDLIKNTDDYVVDRNKIAIVPVRFEFNSESLLNDFKSWKIN